MSFIEHAIKMVNITCHATFAEIRILTVISIRKYTYVISTELNFMDSVSRIPLLLFEINNDFRL